MKKLLILSIICLSCKSTKSKDTESLDSGFLTSGFAEEVSSTKSLSVGSQPDTTSGIMCETITQCVPPCPDGQFLGIHRLCTTSCEDSYDCPGMIAGEVCIQNQCVVVCDTSVMDSCTDVSGAECVSVFGVDVCAAIEP